MAIRRATHAGSWYAGDKETLFGQIRDWCGACSSSKRGRFGVGPHAGYAYSGSVLAHTYTALNADVKRIFVFGPSHTVYFKGIRTTNFDAYDTPVGSVEVDSELVHFLKNELNIKPLPRENEEDEHCLELHMPMLKYTHPKAKIIPLIFGEESVEDDAKLCNWLKLYVDDPHSAIVISSDFCHWGTRFNYLQYTPSGKLEELGPVTRNTKGIPIWKSIEILDHKAMGVASTGSAVEWKNYIRATGNTVCGARPLEAVLKAGEVCGHPFLFEWLDYAQSNRVTDLNGMSVSYAAGIAT